MRQKNMGIWDSDPDYKQALAYGIAGRCREYLVTVIQDRSELETGCWDLLLLGEEWPEPVLEQESVVIWLTEEDGTCIYSQLRVNGREEHRAGAAEQKETEFGRTELYKYETLSELVKGIRFWYGAITGEVTQLTGGERLSPLIGVVAASERALAETASLTAEELAAVDHQVLFLNFEEFPFEPSSQDGTGGDREAGLEDYLYYLLGAERESVYRQLELFLKDSGKGYQQFKMRSGRNCLLALENQEMERFMETVLRAGFDYIVANLGAGTSAHTSLLLTCCTQILLPEEGSEGEHVKNKSMMDYLAREVGDSLKLEEMAFCLNQEVEPLSGRWSIDDSGFQFAEYTQEERRKELKQYVRRIAAP